MWWPSSPKISPRWLVAEQGTFERAAPADAVGEARRPIDETALHPREFRAIGLVVEIVRSCFGDLDLRAAGQRGKAALPLRYW